MGLCRCVTRRRSARRRWRQRRRRTRGCMRARWSCAARDLRQRASRHPSITSSISSHRSSLHSLLRLLASWRCAFEQRFDGQHPVRHHAAMVGGLCGHFHSARSQSNPARYSDRHKLSFRRQLLASLGAISQDAPLHLHSTRERRSISTTDDTCGLDHIGRRARRWSRCAMSCTNRS